MNESLRLLSMLQNFYFWYDHRRRLVLCLSFAKVALVIYLV
jgi:hypothetical protein